MLQASMGYGLEQEQDSPMDDVVGDEPMLQQSKVDEEDSIAQPTQPAAAEQVGQ